MSTQSITLVDLVSDPQWVAWRSEMRDGKLTKLPYFTAQRLAESDNPSTWLPHDQAAAVAKVIVNGTGGGVGIELGQCQKTWIIGIDLDTCRDPDTGSIEPWATEVIDRFDSYTEVSPSGTGVKVFALLTPADVPQLRRIMGTETGRQFKKGSGGDHPPAIELYISNRYFAVTWECLEDARSELRTIPLDDLRWLVEHAGPAFAGAKSEKSSSTDGSRSAIAFREAAALRRQGKSFEEMVSALYTDPETSDWAKTKGEANNQRELKRIWNKTEPLDDEDSNLTEDAIARDFANHYAGRYVYDHEMCVWFEWNGLRWIRDLKLSVFHTAREFARTINSRLNKPSLSLGKIAFASAIERASRADPKMAVLQNIWDSDPWLLGTPDGVVDLRTGTLRPNTPDLHVSRYTSVTPAPPGTPYPLWQRFQDSATQSNKELQGFLQRLCGYAVTGDVTEEMLTFLYGPGGNGKGVFLATLTGIVGDYGVAVPIEVFTAGSYINLEYYRAVMSGARLVTASETESQATWAESQIKEMTGNETPLSARYPYGKPFTYRPQFKIVLVGNHAPKLKGRSPAMERRLRVLPFVNMPPDPDQKLKEKLKAEWPAILRWMLDGCLMWQQNRLGNATVIKAATSAYFEQQDAHRRWIDERCILDNTLSLKPGLLLADFNAWAKANGEDTVTANDFSELIDRTPGLSRGRSNGVRFVKGIGLKAPESTWATDSADQ